MHRPYQDILDRIPEPPLWFDENAVPRYAPFAPGQLANIYAQEAALVVVQCQGCGRNVHVAFSELNLAEELWSMDRKSRVRNIGHLITAGTHDYGDRPNVNCCDAGPTMGSVALRVEQYWYKPVIRGDGVAPDASGRTRIVDLRSLDFKRDSALEIKLPGPQEYPPHLIPIRTRFGPKS